MVKRKKRETEVYPGYEYDLHIRAAYQLNLEMANALSGVAPAYPGGAAVALEVMHGEWVAWASWSNDHRVQGDIESLPFAALGSLTGKLHNLCQLYNR
jgi:hypothetical protein